MINAKYFLRNTTVQIKVIMLALGYYNNLDLVYNPLRIVILSYLSNKKNSINF